MTGYSGEQSPELCGGGGRDNKGGSLPYNKSEEVLWSGSAGYI